MSRCGSGLLHSIAGEIIVKRARYSREEGRDLREKRDLSEGLSARVEPVARLSHVSLVALGADERRIERSAECRPRSQACSPRAVPRPIF